MNTPPLGPLEVSCEDVRDRLADDSDDFLLLDCREQAEYDTVHIDGALLIPMSELTDRVDELGGTERSVVVHCHHGGRSLRVANWLVNQGFEDVKSMAGGIDRWALEIDPALPRY